MKALRPKLSPDLTGKKSYDGPYKYSFTKKEEFIEHQENKGAGWKAGADLSQTLGNFVPFKNASKVFGNGLFRFIGCLRDVSNLLFVPGAGVGWERGEEGGMPKTGTEN